MKKLTFLPLALLGVLSLASCSQDDAPVVNGDGNVHLTVAMPTALESRQFSDGTKAVQLQYAVYEHNTKTPLPIAKQADGKLGVKGVAKFVDKQTTIDLTLATSKNYDIVFWAQDPAVTVYSFDETNQTVTTNFADTPINDDTYDAFTAHYTTGTVTGPISETIQLHRPFAQINIGTNDIKEAGDAGLTVSTVDVVVPSYNTLNIMNDQVGVDGDFAATVTPASVIYKISDVPGSDEVFPIEDYTYLSMNYLLVPKDKSTVDVKFYVNPERVSTYTRAFATYDNVPVQRNHRTNIYGALLTNPAVFNVVIEESFDVPNLDYSIKGWDGSVADELTKDDDNTTVLLNGPDELALFAQQISDGTLPANTPVKLNADMDLNSIEWTPIKGYKGTFDGQHHTIKNLSITKSTQCMGFFDNLTGAKEVKNLTIENVNLVNTRTGGTGAVVGNPFTVALNNITVKGDIYITAPRYVGGVAGHNVYGNCSNITVDANDGSFVRATSTAGTPAHCGGVFGYMGEGNVVLSNLHSNIDVTAGGFGAGGVVGTVQYGNKIENCSSSGAVTLLSPYDEKHAQGIGGIAGVYVASSTRIDINNCTFTGTLSSSIKGVPFTNFLNGGLVGISYSSYSAGVAASNLYIDGVNKPYPAE